MKTGCNAFKILYKNNAPFFLLVQPITLALVYAGTTLKDLSDITHGWHEVSLSRWVRAITSCLTTDKTLTVDWEYSS